MNCYCVAVYKIINFVIKHTFILNIRHYVCWKRIKKKSKVDVLLMHCVYVSVYVHSVCKAYGVYVFVIVFGFSMGS